MTRISLETVAAKLHWLKSQGDDKCDAVLETPRYREALCFLSAMSQLPGGLERFLSAFVEASPDWESELPAEDLFAESMGLSGVSWQNSNYLWEDEGRQLAREPLMRALTWHVSLWCQELHGPDMCDQFPRLFPGFLEALCPIMDSHAEAEIAKTADTTLRRKVFFELDFARGSGRSGSRPVPMVLVADTRHGKTTAVETYCRAWPGRARLVTVPESNHEREFYAAYAEAFGMDFGTATATGALKERVQFTLRHAGVFLVHDESHWLIPIRYHKDTPPQRLNWVRAQIIDRHLPCAFFCTPQSQEETLAKYVQRTHYNLEQWLGRMPKPVLIEDKPSYDDLVAVARARFPEFPGAAIDELCDAADEKVEGAGARVNGESGFKIVEIAGARARYLAEQRGGGVSLGDIRDALAWAGAPLPAPSPTRPREFSSPSRSGLGRRGIAADAPQRLRSGSTRVLVSEPGVTA